VGSPEDEVVVADSRDAPELSKVDDSDEESVLVLEVG
jgi:hypothetical protein